MAVERSNDRQPVLVCGACRATFHRDPREQFYDLRSRPVSQSRSLLVHEPETDRLFRETAFGRFSVRAFVHRLRAIVGRDRPGTILDIGCGGGEYGVALQGLCENYYGLDPSDIPPVRRLPHPAPANVILAHHDTDAELPVGDETVDLVCVLASYDHIPNRTDVLADACRTLKPGGRLLIGMSNYGFWMKRLLRGVTARRLFQHAEHHYCVHSPATLMAEVASVDARLKPLGVVADFVYLPNVPVVGRAIYASEAVVRALNAAAAGVLRPLAPRGGSSMLVLFEKTR